MKGGTQVNQNTEGGMAVDQQSNICIALASAPNTVADETPEEAAFCCDQHGILMDCDFCTPSENEKIWSASRELRSGHMAGV